MTNSEAKHEETHALCKRCCTFIPLIFLIFSLFRSRGLELIELHIRSFLQPKKGTCFRTLVSKMKLGVKILVTASYSGTRGESSPWPFYLGTRANGVRISMRPFRPWHDARLIQKSNTPVVMIKEIDSKIAIFPARLKDGHDDGILMICLPSFHLISAAIMTAMVTLSECSLLYPLLWPVKINTREICGH